MGCLSDTLRGVHCPDPLTLRTTQYLKVEINSEKNVCVYIYIYIYIYIKVKVNFTLEQATK